MWRRAGAQPARPRIYELDYLKFSVNILVIYHHLIDQARGDHRKPHVLGFSYWDPAYANVVEPFVMQAASFASGVVFSSKLTVKSARTFLSLGAGYWILQVRDNPPTPRVLEFIRCAGTMCAPHQCLSGRVEKIVAHMQVARLVARPKP